MRNLTIRRQTIFNPGFCCMLSTLCSLLLHPSLSLTSQKGPFYSDVLCSTVGIRWYTHVRPVYCLFNDPVFRMVYKKKITTGEVTSSTIYWLIWEPHWIRGLWRWRNNDLAYHHWLLNCKSTWHQSKDALLNSQCRPFGQITNFFFRFTFGPEIGDLT